MVLSTDKNTLDPKLRETTGEIIGKRGNRILGCILADGSVIETHASRVLPLKASDIIDLADYESEVEAMAEWVSSARPLPGFNKV